MGYTRQGAWVVKEGNRYRTLPVRFHFDSAGNLLGYVDPWGGVKTFHTTYSVQGNVHSYVANACDYFIATVPTHRWVMVDPYRAGFIDDRGVVWPLNHSLTDIAAKRADVADWLCQQYNVCITQPPNTAATTAALQERQPRYVGCARLPAPVANTQATSNRLDEGSAQAMVQGLMEQFAQALLAWAPPGFRELYDNMVKEGQRQELLLRQRLPPERYRYYQNLRSRINQLSTYGYITDEQWRMLHKMVYQRMAREAGLTEEELLRTSPYMRNIAAAVGKIPGASQLQPLIEARIQGKKLAVRRNDVRRAV